MRADDLIVLMGSALLTLALFLLANSSPMMEDRFRRWYQITFLSPRVGELAVLEEPSFEDCEALIFRMSRTMFPADRVPFGEIVVIIGIDGGTAVVVWGDQVARLPRRWLRRPKV
jgi:hypothetical protein